MSSEPLQQDESDREYEEQCRALQALKGTSGLKVLISRLEADAKRVQCTIIDIDHPAYERRCAIRDGKFIALTELIAGLERDLAYDPNSDD